LTLHVGLGTFLPIRSDKVEDHHMHSEWYHIPDGTLDAIQAIQAGRESANASLRGIRDNGSGRSEEPRNDGRDEASRESGISGRKIKVFTTRPDTIMGATFLVVAPEYPGLDYLVTDDTRDAVSKYKQDALKKSEIERQENKEKTGVFTGSYAINPATKEKIPVYVADYVLAGYGTGAIMAVPAYDDRDREFAEKFDLPIVEAELIDRDLYGAPKTTYKMRDWLISRQRYWGCPIPIAYDKDGNPHPIPEDQLPVVLPEIKDYKPDSSGRSALTKAKDWLKVQIPVKNEKTGETHMEEMTRETDTLDGYACSSWYLWRYASPHDQNHAWDPEAIKYWEPVDVYVGADHAVAHLLYVRFWCKFFADLGYLPFREPIKKLIYHGYINATDGKKMSKSKGNVIDPLDVINDGYGADTLRTYEMFIGPVELDAAWDPRSVGGVYRFLNRCYNLCFDKDGSNSNSSSNSFSPDSDSSSSLETVRDNGSEIASEPRNDSSRSRADKKPVFCVEATPNGRPLVDGRERSGSREEKNVAVRHKTIKKVTEDIYHYQFNTAVAALMEYVNELYKQGATEDDLIILAKLLKPFAPHLASEMLEHLSATDEWPTWDDKYLTSTTATVVVQVNGKLRATLTTDASDLDDEQKILDLALADKKIQKYTASGIKKTIFIKKAKLVNIVV
ncbi:class I tRNA ligase family protein, partial [Candidatus Saccharibacteria bacterium]|nr:class I tRNA ligase family protein [Candidatus Saccharibacteria bacterium]